MIIIICVENSYAASYFCINCDAFYFSGFFHESSKEQHLLEIEYFCNITFIYLYFVPCNNNKQNIKYINKIINLNDVQEEAKRKPKWA